MIWILIIGIIVILDQVVKYMVVQNLAIGASITVIDKFFSIYHTVNTGAAWSIFMGQRVLFIIITLIACVVIAYLLIKSKDKLLKLALSLIFAGAVGNLIDRIAKGSVTDFLRFDFGSYMFPIFNVADMSVVIGSALLMYYMFFIYKD
ncbi:MAG: signal peptidase II [Clostridiaceae bacterium]|nr:signal peptidase II [Clostridiaceae bacterium]